MKMYFEIFLLIITVIILIYLFLYFAQVLYSPTVSNNSVGSVCFNENCFNVELVATKAQVERGLMYREKLDKDKGMLFIFEKESRRSFWMKNTLIPLDIIWIDSKNKVVFISKDTQPCKSLICPSVDPGENAKYVLEINAGMSDQIGLEVGSELKINMENKPAGLVG